MKLTWVSVSLWCGQILGSTLTNQFTLIPFNPRPMIKFQLPYLKYLYMDEIMFFGSILVNFRSNLFLHINIRLWSGHSDYFGGGKNLMLVEENVKLMLHNQINVNSITAATSILNSALFWREKKYKMLITKFLVFSGKLLKHVLAFSSISSMTDVRVVLWIFFWVRWVSKTGWANFKKQKSGNGFCIWYNIRVKLEIRKADSTEF